jgi:hypothetical protein
VTSELSSDARNNAGAKSSGRPTRPSISLSITGARNSDIFKNSAFDLSRAAGTAAVQARLATALGIRANTDTTCSAVA